MTTVAREIPISDSPPPIKITPRRIIIFDLGQVFVKFISQNSNAELLARCTGQSEEVERFFSGHAWHAYERGEIGSDDIFQAAVRDIGYQGTYKDFEDDICRTFELDREMFAFLNSLKLLTAKRGIQLWLLSNISDIQYRYINSRWPGIFSSFLRVYLSHEIGARKPDQATYQKIIKDGGAKPEECIFVDDLQRNGDGAIPLGIAFILFEGLVKLKDALSKFDPKFEIPAEPLK